MSDDRLSEGPVTDDGAGRVLTVFRNRLRADGTGEYGALAPHILDLARSMPGFVDAKGFVAADGERVTIVTFADRATHEAWRDQPEHRAAQRRGVVDFYAEYAIQVATVTYEHRFRHDGAGS